MAIERFDCNPLITPADVPPTQEGLAVYCTINAGATWLGDEAMELLWDAVDWVESLGVFGYGLGAGCVLLVVLVLLWYGSRR